MLNKLFSRPGKPTEKETVGENSSKKQKSISANDIYIALKKYTSIGGKHFKIGLFPTLPERGVVVGFFAAIAEKGGMALSFGIALTRDEAIAEGIHEAKSPWYKRVNITGGLLWNDQRAGDNKTNIALPTILSFQQAGNGGINIGCGAISGATQRAGDGGINIGCGAITGAIQRAGDNGTNKQLGAGILAGQQAGDNGTNKQLGAIIGAIQRAGDNGTNKQLGAGILADQETENNGTNKQLGAGILAGQETGNNGGNRQLGALVGAVQEGNPEDSKQIGAIFYMKT